MSKPSWDDTPTGRGPEPNEPNEPTGFSVLVLFRCYRYNPPGPETWPIRNGSSHA